MSSLNSHKQDYQLLKQILRFVVEDAEFRQNCNHTHNEIVTYRSIFLLKRCFYTFLRFFKMLIRTFLRFIANFTE